MYIPQKIIEDPTFPFEDESVVKIEIQNNQIILKNPEWWELLDWNEMKTAYQALPDEIKQKIKENDLAPKITA
ncbi:hypothetical protein KQH65_10090 [archaeon]|nr:hypothetical protein [archaeon]